MLMIDTLLRCKSIILKTGNLDLTFFQMYYVMPTIFICSDFISVKKMRPLFHYSNVIIDPDSIFIYNNI